MAVERDRRAGLEADEVQHRVGAEQGLARDACRELERAHRVETDALCVHRSIIVARRTAVEGAVLPQRGYLDGSWVDAASGETFSVFNPATGESIAEVP